MRFDDATGTANDIRTDYVNVGGAALRLKKTGGGAFVPEYTHFDSQGSPVAATNAAGTITWRERYAPFGEELLNPPLNADNTAYTGHLKDDATGLNYMQARYYDPIIGRFLSTDPIGYQDQLNLYAYVANDPVNNVDPTGESAISILFKIVIKGGDVGAALKGVTDDLATIANPTASSLDKGIALVSLASEAFSPVSLKDAKAGAEAAKKSYQTYTKRNPETGEVYSGRTSGTGTPEQNVARRDASHHKNEDGFGPAELDKSSSNPDAIRGREQQLIDANGGAQSKGGTSGNSVNGISETNPKREQYMKACNEEFCSGG